MSIKQRGKTEKLRTKDVPRIIIELMLRMGRSKLNEAYEGRG